MASVSAILQTVYAAGPVIKFAVEVVQESELDDNNEKLEAALHIVEGWLSEAQTPVSWDAFRPWAVRGINSLVAAYKRTGRFKSKTKPMAPPTVR